MKDKALTAIGVTAFIFLMAYVGPSIDEAVAVHEDNVSAAKQAAKRERFEQRAQAMCGENAGWRETPDGKIACFTKRGHKTMVGSL